MLFRSDPGQRLPEESGPADSRINAEFSQPILADRPNANMDDDEPISTQRSARQRGNHQLDGSDDREDETRGKKFSETRFSAAMDISSPSHSASPFRSTRSMATPLSAQPPRQAPRPTGLSDLPSPSQAFSATKKSSDRRKEIGREKANAARDKLAHSSPDNTSKSLPPPVNQFASLKDRLANKKTGKAPKTKILAKRTSTSRRTKSMGDSLPAEEPTSEPREASAPPKADIGAEDVLFVSQSQPQTRSSRKRQFVPNMGQGSSPFKVPSGSHALCCDYKAVQLLLRA